MKKILLIVLMLWHLKLSALTVSLNLVEVPIAEAISLLAPFVKRNLIVNPAIQGSVNLQVREVEAQQVLTLLMRTQGLASLKVGDIWYIDFKDVLLKRKEQETKWLALKDINLPRIFKVWRIKYSKANDIVNLLKDDHHALLSKDGLLRVDQRTNSILIYDTKDKIRSIETLIKQFDIAIDQVLIEARVVSVDQDCERELGINFVSKMRVNPEKQALDTKVESGQFSLAVATLADKTLLDVKLAALERVGKAELISTPSLFTGNLETAAIEAGEEVPYQEVSESGGTAVVFKKAVLALKVTPHILPHKRVLLRLQINQDRPSNKMVLGVPTISTRQITTHILAKAGQTIVLGGIFESNQENGYQGLPYLAHVPILNFLFKQQNRRLNKRELLIFVTPRLIYL